MLSITGRYKASRFITLVHENLNLVDLLETYNFELKTYCPQNDANSIHLKMEASKGASIIVTAKRKLRKIKDKEAVVFCNLKIDKTKGDDKWTIR